VFAAGVLLREALSDRVVAVFESGVSLLLQVAVAGGAGTGIATTKVTAAAVGSGGNNGNSPGTTPPIDTVLTIHCTDYTVY
jgi:hypothetical protein